MAYRSHLPQNGKPDLSVVPVTPELWSRILELSGAALALSTQEDQE